VNHDNNQGAVAIGFGLMTAIFPTIIWFVMVTHLFWFPLVAGIVICVLGFRALFTETWLSHSIGWIALIVMLVAYGGLIVFCVSYPIF
jgi:hypothetical protein